MSLSDTATRNAKPKDKPYKMPDGGGLYLYVTTTGGKLWRLDYRSNGMRKTLSFGAYPAVSLMEAREKREEARKLLAKGKDPGEEKKEQKAARLNTFEAVACRWFDTWKVGKPDSHSSKVIARLEKNVFPWIGKIPVTEITQDTIEPVLLRMSDAGKVETAHRVKACIKRIMGYAKRGHVLYGAFQDLLPSTRKKHRAAITDPVKVGELLRAIDQYQGSHVVRAALALAPLVFVRPGELRAARWADVDLERAEWRYTMSKVSQGHIVPLTRQAVEILRGIEPVTGKSEYVFAGERHGRPISNMTINRALQAMGYDTQTEMTAHGFRAMARTILDEEMGYPFDVIEHQLGHAVKDANGQAYNRTTKLRERTAMMQAWADYLDRLKKGADVIPLRTAG